MENTERPHMKAHCCLCEEIKTGQFPAEYGSVYGVGKRIYLESDNFIAIPTVSPLCTGHTMLLPKHHYTSIMSCPKVIKDEALVLARSLYADLTERFGPLFLFEHGVGRIEDVACGINHAHLHFVPLSGLKTTAVIDDIKLELGELEVGTVHHLLSKQANQQAYLIFGANLDEMYIVCRDSIPSQIVRRLVAARLNRREWNWRLLDGTTDFIETLSTLCNLKTLAA